MSDDKKISQVLHTSFGSLGKRMHCDDVYARSCTNILRDSRFYMRKEFNFKN